MTTLRDHIHHYLGGLAIFIADGVSPVKVSGISTNGLVTVSDPNAIDAGMEASIYDLKLVLRKINSLTEEEALELCKIAAPTAYGNYRFKKWEVKRDPKSDQFWEAYDITNENSPYSFVIDLIDGEVRVYDDKEIEPSLIEHGYWQWYYKKGFDIPVFPENKTLIELGLAIDSTTLKT